MCRAHASSVSAGQRAKLILCQELIGSDNEGRMKGPESSDEWPAAVVQVPLDEGKLDADHLHQAVFVQVPSTHDLQ